MKTKMTYLFLQERLKFILMRKHIFIEDIKFKLIVNMPSYIDNLKRDKLYLDIFFEGNNFNF